VPPLYTDEWSFHNPKLNSAFSYSLVTRFIAYKENKAVGRIMGIINKKYNELHEEKSARFYQLDCINDQEVASALIARIENWSKENGMNKIIGPYGFSDKDPQGLQIEGLDHLPVIATPTNAAYLQSLVEFAGYQKEVDCVSYQIPVHHQLPPLFEKIYARVSQNSKFRLLDCNTKRQLKPYILPVFRLVNETYAPLFGFVPMSELEMKRFADQYLPVLDPAFVKIVVNLKNEVIAFGVAMPDMSPGIQRAKGKLFPFGFIHILSAMKKAKQLNILLGAVKPEYRGKGITVLLAKSLFESAIKRNMKTIDSHLILESNKPMRAECEHAGGTVYKRFRIYQKLI
jgi:GNAT superfamily N-acetyltransferase